jgi:hypothetical protein
MKHQVCASLLLVSFSLCADFEAQSIADKSKRVGRFSYEDSFDENLVETVLEKSSVAVKRNVKRLLYPAAGQEMQRLLLLGGVSNASTTAIAKSIATRCGYEYYVVEASALLQEYREGQQMLLSEIRPIIKQGKPIAIIITELPEMADYSGLLASTLWLLIDQCAQYPDVFVIGTSAFQKGQLSEEIKDRFGGDIISVALDKSMQDSIENAAALKPSWLERNKVACFVAGGIGFFALGVVHLYMQMLFADEQIQLKNKKIVLQQRQVQLKAEEIIMGRRIAEVQEDMFLVQKQQPTFDQKKFELQKTLRNEVMKHEKESFEFQKMALRD